MADSPYRVGYDIGAKVDYSQIKDATKAAGELINKLQKVQDLQKGRTAGSTGDSMKSAMRSTAQETQNVTNKAKTAAEAQAKLADQMKKTANSGKSMKSTAETIQTVGNHSKTAAGQVNILQRSITKVKNVGTQSFKAISDHVRRFGETSEATRKKLDRLNETGKKFRDVGYNMLPISVAVGAAFVQGAKDATKLQHRYTIIRNLIKTGGESTVASVKNTKKMMSQGRDMSLKYGISQESIAKGYESLVRRGYQSNQALAAQKTYLQGSIASGDKYSDVVTTAASAIESFGLKSKNTIKMTENTKKAVNQMAYAADLTATSFSDLGEAMKFAGPDAYGAHQTLSQTSAAIGELSNAHIEGSQAGTSLRQIYQRLINPPQKGKAPNALKQLGLNKNSFRDAKNNLLPIADIFDKLSSRMKGMSRTQRGGIYAALFGANASSAANVLGTHVKQLKELTGQVAKAQKQGKGGYVAGLSQKNLHSWQNQFKRFKTSVDQLGMSFAKSVLPTLTPMVEKLNNLVTAFGKLPKPMKEAVAYGTAFVALAGPLTVGVGSMMSTAAVLGIGASKSGSGIGKLVGKAGKAFLPAAAKDYGYIQLGIQGVQAITNASTIFTKGITSSQGAKAAWQTGGQLVGGGIGAFLGGPAGAGIGAQIGGFIGEKIPKAVEQSVKTDQKWSDNPKHGVQKGSVYIPDVGWSFDPRKTGVSGGSRSTRNTSRKPSAPSGMTTSRAYGDLSKSNAAYIKKAVSLEQQGNIAWANSAGKTSTKVSAIYNKLYKLADKQAQKQLSSSQKGLSYLQKQGLLSSSAASKAKNAEQSSINSRLRALKSGLNKINSDSKLSYSQRAKLIQRNNAQIISLTDRGAQKQKSIMRGLMSSTTHLTTSGYAKILTSSRKNEQQTVSNARKTYSAERSSANKRYATNVHLAKTLPKLSSVQRRGIIAQAEKQRSQSISKAYNQYKGAVKYAEKQRRYVVSAAKREAGDAARAFSTAAKDVGSSIPALINQNLKLGLSTRNPKFKSSDLTNSRNSRLIKQNQTLNRLATHSRTPGQNGTASKATKPKLPGNVFSTRATGGKVSRAQTALVGEGGPELAYTVRGRKARLLGVNGPQMAKLKPGEHILNALATKRVLAGNYGQTLPGYANGNTNLGTSKANNSLDKFSKKSKKTWAKTYADTSKSTKKINKNTVGDYDTMQKNSAKQLTQLKGANSSAWKSIYSNTSKRTNSLRKSTVSDFNSMQQGSQKQMNQLESGIVAAAKATAIGFGKEMARMKGYAHAAMSGAIGQLNQGISGIDSVLGQFGGNHSVIKPIKYAHGSNGQLTENQMAMVNDATAGPRQELIVRNNNVYAPQGKNRVLPLHKGDQVLNGRQSQEFAAMQGIAHYAKGSGVSKSGLRKIADTNSSHPTKAFNNEYNVHIDLGGSTLQKGSTALGKNSSNKLGPAWSKAMWGVIQDAIQGGGSAAGGNWRHSPGAGFHVTSGFGYRGATAGGMADHDGNDFSGAKTVHSVHGGTVIYAGGAPANWGGGNGIGENLVTKGSDGWYVIYQEFNGKNNSGAPMYVHRGDTVKTGQRVAALGPSGTHVHIGVSRNNPFSNSGSTTRGWNDLLNMHGHSSGTPKQEKADGRLTKLAKAELGKSALSWISKHLVDEDAAGSAGAGAKPTGSHAHWLKQAGMPESWWPWVNKIIGQESGWRATENNPRSSAYGIPQALPGSKMASAGSDWRTNPITQLRWMKGYIKGRYGNAENAWKIRQTRGWYANGGWSKDKQLNIFGEVAGQREVAINPKRKSADNLIDQTIEARATADKSSPSADYLNSIKALKVKQSRPKIEPKITLNFYGDISDEKTMNKAVDKFKRGLTDVLTQINDEFGLDDSVW